MTEIVVVGLFRDRFTAAHAAERLTGMLGIDPTKISLHGPGEARGALPLGGLALPWHDHAFYAEGLRRDRVALAVVVEDVLGNRAAELLETSGAVDLDAQEEEFRRDGWAPPPAPSGFTGHDEDIGYATYGADAVIGPIPQRHVDDTPAGLLGRWEQAAMERDRTSDHRCSRRYIPSCAPQA